MLQSTTVVEQKHDRILVPMLRHYGEPLPPVEATEFGDAFSRFGDARVVLLGEATHGSSEFYRARAAITRHLIEEHGFSIVAVEADWPDAAQIDRHVRRRAASVPGGTAFTRFPSWMWRNAEVAEFVDWLHQHNADVPRCHQVEFRGLDLYSLGASMAAVLDYLESRDPAAAAAARRRYGCLTPWQDDPTQYGSAVLRGLESCEDAVTEQLQALLASRLEAMAADGATFFDAAQNARVVRAAEQYYRTMYRGSTESWNLRDRHMFETLRALKRARGVTAKAVVWAHNSHIGDAAATAMGWQGEFNVGELCRATYGEDAVLIGFGTDRGSVAAASDWDGPMEIKRVRPARADSYEHAFQQAGLGRSLTDWRGSARDELKEALNQPMIERAIGVIYRPETELQSHYFQAAMADQFDAYVWFEETTAISPLPAASRPGVPDTYPFGL